MIEWIRPELGAWYHCTISPRMLWSHNPNLVYMCFFTYIYKVQVIIVRMSWQLSCRDMYTFVTSLDHNNQNKSKTVMKIFKISIKSSLVVREIGPVLCLMTAISGNNTSKSQYSDHCTNVLGHFFKSFLLSESFPLCHGIKCYLYSIILQVCCPCNVWGHGLTTCPCMSVHFSQIYFKWVSL